jgi:hypothetical protein
MAPILGNPVRDRPETPHCESADYVAQISAPADRLRSILSGRRYPVDAARSHGKYPDNPMCSMSGGEDQMISSIGYGPERVEP